LFMSKVVGVPAAAGGDAAAAGAAAGAGGCAGFNDCPYRARIMSKSVSVNPRSRSAVGEAVGPADRTGAGGTATADVAVANMAGDVAASTAQTVGTGNNGTEGGTTATPRTGG